MKTTKEVLLEAAALIEQPGKWTRGTFAKNERGEVVNEQDPDAVCFCALGAIGRAARGDSSVYGGAKHAVTRVLYQRGLLGSISRFNDEGAKDAAEVVALLRDAAETQR